MRAGTGIVMTLINGGKGQTPRRLESNILELVVSPTDPTLELVCTDERLLITN